MIRRAPEVTRRIVTVLRGGFTLTYFRSSSLLICHRALTFLAQHDACSYRLLFRTTLSPSRVFAARFAESVGNQNHVVSSRVLKANDKMINILERSRRLI